MMNTYSDYDDGNHGGNQVETSVYRTLEGATTRITADMVGPYRFTFTAESPASDGCGSSNSVNGASGGTCHGFVKVVDQNTWGLLLFERVETTSASVEGETFTLEFELTASHVGHIYQIGFMNLATNWAPTAMQYDDCVVEARPPSN